MHKEEIDCLVRLVILCIVTVIFVYVVAYTFIEYFPYNIYGIVIIFAADCIFSGHIIVTTGRIVKKKYKEAFGNER